MWRTHKNATPFADVFSQFTGRKRHQLEVFTGDIASTAGISQLSARTLPALQFCMLLLGPPKEAAWSSQSLSNHWKFEASGTILQLSHILALTSSACLPARIIGTLAGHANLRRISGRLHGTLRRPHCFVPIALITWGCNGTRCFNAG